MMAMRAVKQTTQAQRGSLKLVDPGRIVLVTDPDSPIGACPRLPRAWDHRDRLDRPRSDAYREYVAHGMPLVAQIPGSRSLLLAKRRAEYLEIQSMEVGEIWAEVLNVPIEQALEMAIADVVYDRAMHAPAKKVRELACYVDWLYRAASYRSSDSAQSLKPVVRSVLGAEARGRPPVKHMIADIAGYSSRVTRDTAPPHRQPISLRERAAGDRPHVRGSARIQEVHDPVTLKRGSRARPGQLELKFRKVGG